MKLEPNSIQKVAHDEVKLLKKGSSTHLTTNVGPQHILHVAQTYQSEREQHNMKVQHSKLSTGDEPNHDNKWINTKS